jgi:hypothetical protein
VRRAVPLLALALAGCGSAAARELPDPAGPPPSPALTERPAGRELDGAAPAAPVVAGGRTYSLSAAAGAVRVRPECADPVALAGLDRGAKLAVLCGRERSVELYDRRTLERVGSVGAGIGPTGLATDGVELLYVVDSVGEALLVFHLRPRFELIRRVHLGGGPYAIAFDGARRSLWITLNGANRLDNYAAGSRPVIRDTVPMIRGARAVAVDGGVVTVSGHDQRQVLRVRSK